MKKKIQPSYLKTSYGAKLAYHHYEGKKNSPGIIFLGGFLSDMNGTKAITLDKFCRKNKITFTRFDYRGHGESSGKFEEGSIGDWLKDATEIFDKITKGKTIIVGSSMGGWIGLLLALKRKSLIAAFVGIAAAPDFTEYLIWNNLDKKTRDEIRTKGVKMFPSDWCGTYPITYKLITDGRKNLLLHKKIPLACPARLIQGMKDEEVPWQNALRLADQITSKDTQIIFQKNGDHRMSEKEDLELLYSVIEGLT